MNSEDKKYTKGAGILIASLMLSNVLNFLYNAFLGRVLSFEDYAIITVVANIWLIIGIAINALASTVNHETAYLSTKVSESSTLNFYKRTRNKSLIYSTIATFIWLASIPFLGIFFNIKDLSVFFFFSPIIILGILLNINKGFLQGNLFFLFGAIATLVETFTKLLLGIFFVVIHQNHLAYLSVPISIAVAFLVSIIFVYKTKIKSESKETFNFPTKFMFASVLNGLAATAFLTIDILMAKHYLNDNLAGQYALLSLIGKMIYFFGSLLSSLMITVISRSDGENKDSNSYFYKFFAITAFFSICGFFVLGPAGKIFTPILFGDKTNAIFPYLTTYTLAIALFTLSNTIIVYHLAKKQYLFPIVGVIISSLMIPGIIIFHDRIFHIVYVVLGVSFLSFFSISILHFLKNQGRFIFRNFLDLLDLFYPLPQNKKKEKNNKKKILIFNWRDTKHSQAGGAEVYVHELAKRWAKDGNKVTLFCGSDGNSDRYEIVDGVEVIRRGGFYFVYVWAFFYYLFKFRGKYDVILDCQNGVPFFTPLYAKEPVYCVMHHVHQQVFKESLPGLLASFAMFLEKHTMPWAYRNNHFIAVSESTKKEMEEINLVGKGINIIHNGVDLQKLFPGEKYDVPTILYLGRLKAYKSLDVIIKAFKDVLKSVPNAKLIIAGGGDEEKKLKKLTNDLNLNKNIIFKGKVTEQEKLNLLQKAWVFVNPSRMEGWGITTIEANACGTPVIASNVPGLRDSVNNPHTGYLVDYGNEKEFAEKITKVLKKHDHRKSLSENAIEWAKNFDWGLSAKQLFELI